jgi:hypothetical protein
MYLRFVTTRIDQDSHKPEGVFMAAYTLLNSGDLTKEQWKRLRQILDWFGQNLPTPPKNFYAGRAIFWFDASAEESIKKIWEIIHFLKEHDYHVEVYKCRRLANVCYRDKFQVAAYPSKLDSKIIVN